MDIPTVQALIRFGLGRRGAEAPPADPHRWLADQIRLPDPAREGQDRTGARQALIATS